jgi:hypothetical protein
MRRQITAVKSGGDYAKVRSLGPFFFENFLRIIEAAATLHVAPERGISRFGRSRAAASRLADVRFSQAIA